MPDPAPPSPRCSPPPSTDPAEFAGALAEAGIEELIYTEPGTPPRTLHARVTDLPGVLQAAPVGATLCTPGRQTHLTREPDGWRRASSR